MMNVKIGLVSKTMICDMRLKWSNAADVLHPICHMQLTSRLLNATSCHELDQNQPPLRLAEHFGKLGQLAASPKGLTSIYEQRTCVRKAQRHRSFPRAASPTARSSSVLYCWTSAQTAGASLRTLEPRSIAVKAGVRPQLGCSEVDTPSRTLPASATRCSSVRQTYQTSQVPC